MSYESHKPKGAAPLIVDHGFFTGSTSYDRGAGLVKNALLTDTTHPATVAFGARGNYLYKPTAAVGAGIRFAGVARHGISAHSGGRSVELLKPGSICEVALGCNVTVGDILGCSINAADGGRFTNAPGMIGPGAVKILQTKADAVLASDMAGATSTITTAKNVLADSGADFVTAGIKTGDRVFLVGIENNASVHGIDADGNTVDAREVRVKSVTDLNNIVLDATVTSAASAAVVSYYIVRGNPTAQAEILGPENCAEYWPSGMVQMIMPGSVGHASADTFAILQGVSVAILGGQTVTVGNARETLANGLVPGERVHVKALGAPTTNNFEVKPAASGLQIDHATALVSVELTDAGGWITLRWEGRRWIECERSAAGITVNAT